MPVNSAPEAPAPSSEPHKSWRRRTSSHWLSFVGNFVPLSPSTGILLPQSQSAPLVTLDKSAARPVDSSEEESERDQHSDTSKLSAHARTRDVPGRVSAAERIPKSKTGVFRKMKTAFEERKRGEWKQKYDRENLARVRQQQMTSTETQATPGIQPTPGLGIQTTPVLPTTSGLQTVPQATASSTTTHTRQSSLQIPPSSRPQSPDYAGAISSLKVSMGLKEQSLFYGQLDFLFCDSANRFLLAQIEAGRVSPNKAHKMHKDWKRQGKLRVAEFQFDAGTLQNFISGHQSELEFRDIGEGGDKARKAEQVSDILYGWNMTIKEMEKRVLCAHNLTLHRQVMNAKLVLQILGAPEVNIMTVDKLCERVLELERM